MRTRLKEVVVMASLLVASLTYAESENTTVATESAPIVVQPQETATGSEAATEQVALQTDTPQDNTLRSIKVYPCF